MLSFSTTPCLLDAPASVFKYRKASIPDYLLPYRDEIEPCVFSVMGEWRPQYRGAEWLYLATDTGAFFIEPVLQENVTLFNPRNRVSVCADSTTAGMALSLVAFERLGNFTGDSAFHTAYNRLWNDAMDLATACDIQRIIG